MFPPSGHNNPRETVVPGRGLSLNCCWSSACWVLLAPSERQAAVVHHPSIIANWQLFRTAIWPANAYAGCLLPNTARRNSYLCQAPIVQLAAHDDIGLI